MERRGGAVRAALRRAEQWLPRGGTLPLVVLRQRHRWVLRLLWLHVPGLAALAVHQGAPPLHGLADAAPVAVLALLAGRHPHDAPSRAVWASLGLLTCSAIVVHLSGGLIEAHFHFFVVVAVVALYQDWVAFLLAIGYVAVHHAVVSVLAPVSVFSHSAGQEHPVHWALLHAAFVLAAAATHVVAWRSSELAAHDALTGLPGAALFARRLERALTRGPAVVLYLDLDGFKGVNDALGHGAGDAVLVSAADRAQTGVRQGDVVARLGGDEFAVLLPRTDEATAAGVAERLVARLSEPVVLAGRPVRVGASAGLTAAARGETAEQVLARADAAMYEAKRAGKGRLFVPPPARAPESELPASA